MTLKNVIIGSGEGGKYLAWHLAESGQQTVVVERRWIGGSCPNINCLPRTNLSAVAITDHHAGTFGVASRSTDMGGVRKQSARCWSRWWPCVWTSTKRPAPNS